MEFLHYKAGDFRSEWRTGQEYVQADYLDPWWQIVVGYPGITEQEISDITRTLNLLPEKMETNNQIQ